MSISSIIRPLLSVALTVPFLGLGLTHASSGVQIENLGPKVNSQYSELSPVISADGNMLIFIRESHPQNTLANSLPKTQDIWYSVLDENGQWSEAEHQGDFFNANQFNAVNWISPNQNKILLQGAFENGKLVGPGISLTQVTADGWAEPTALNVLGYQDMINKEGFEYSMMSNDGQTILFSFSEINDKNNNDMYISFLQDDGSWSKPKNLGPTINTPDFSEFGPFLASDNTTIYFSSDRAGGLGGNDIWMSKKLDDSWENWSAPVNLGAPINTAGNDSYFTIDAKGEFAYMASSLNSYGARDIVKVKLAEEEKPNPVVLVYGHVYNTKTKAPLSAQLKYETLPNNTSAGNALSNPGTGEYKIILPYGSEYSFRASADNFLSVSENLDLTKVGEYQEIQKDLYLTPIEKGVSIVLNNIFFDLGKTTLKPASFAELNRLLKIFVENPKLEVEISGHTDNVGKDPANLKLSDGRANAVKDYLVAQGVDPTKIIAKGYGKNKAIADNKTEAGRAKNRRVEFSILKN
jgi:OOP family OmpA-OmpF porin